MLKLKSIVGTLLVSALMIACTAIDTTAHNPQPHVTKASSTSSIIDNKEMKYARLYQLNKNRSGTQDAIDSVESGSRVVKVIVAGRGNTVIPAFDHAPKNCQLEVVEGMGDVIYGENHMMYRKFMRDYSKDFNTVMKKYCK